MADCSKSFRDDDLLRAHPRGLYCEAGGFFVDPWMPVDRAVVTHAHSDHAKSGCGSYLTSDTGAGPLSLRVGREASIQTVKFGEAIVVGGVRVSLHPAGHLLGSAQIRLEHCGRITVMSGDYKTDPDPTCEAFEPVRCDTFITESTFGLPVYRWPDPKKVSHEINAWWRSNAQEGVTSILYAYALGKTQRLLAMLDAGIGPILLHGSAESMTNVYRASGVELPTTLHANVENAKAYKKRAIVIAPMSANGATWVNKFRPFSGAFASGWMAVRGARRRRAVDRGFVVSDHVDWPSLIEVIHETGATRVGVTHGFTAPVVRWLREQRGLDAFVVPTRYEATDDPPPGKRDGVD